MRKFSLKLLIVCIILFALGFSLLLRLALFASVTWAFEREYYLERTQEVVRYILSLEFFDFTAYVAEALAAQHAEENEYTSQYKSYY